MAEAKTKQKARSKPIQANPAGVAPLSVPLVYCHFSIKLCCLLEFSVSSVEILPMRGKNLILRIPSTADICLIKG